MLYNWEKAIAFNFLHIKKVRLEVVPPQVIKTIKHKAQQVPSFSIPRALQLIAIKMLRERLKNGVLKYYDSPYRNLQFLIEKKSKAYHLINAAVKMNRRTIQDANLPLSVDKFFKEFAGCQIALIIDLFSKYNQIELDVRSRDLTGFQTPIRLLQITTLL